MSLAELVDNSRTDKNTRHSYLDLYQNLLVAKKETAQNVLEIGIGDGGQGITNGGSIKLWYDYFVNAKVYALDIQDINAVWNGIKNNDRIILHTSVDAYSKEFVQSEFLDKEIKFDMMLDDGPHTLESMKSFITLYSPLLADNGILIIEDIQDPKWIDELYKVVPDNLKEFVSAYDLRKNKNRYDDIVLAIRNKK
jgi:methylase of polypeptide subunit release factors